MEHKKQLLDELEKLGTSMDIPFARRKDYRWIMDNVLVDNSDDKKINKMIKICQFLIKGEENG